MTTIFDGYDEEYKSLAQSVSAKISEISSYEEEPDKKRTAITHASDLLTQASQLIQQMDLEVRSLDAATKRELSKKVDQYKKSLKSLSDDLKNIKAKEEKEGLFGSAEARSRMAGATQKLQQTGDRIKAAHQTVLETEEVAIGIQEELGRNREKIQATHDKVKSVNDMARSGGRILGRMSARDKRQKLILYGVMGFMVLAIVIVLFSTIFGRP
ncbi:hypothetical protein H310_06601 [Aphanomyces invadans]|uniref:Vesicle transport v-SNARE N-terminal domain-containing protein n=1 Tax=Aphanomyces invadans TaxID=157072 RepID=A0A024U5U3_9STRA|nr:hypothetical protein H310_06601 [Aphanomyces invadans]ETW00953.1 hypothetical protein H310_06601 [Aphanomyces invadans]|eukprot:XP_008869951.1 hypothetical protein H310_06601 [Aphanomyces invadans]